MNFRDLKLGTKQMTGFGVILLLMAGANMFSINRMRDIKIEIDEVTTNRLPRAFAISALKLNAFDLRVNQLQHAFARDSLVRSAQAEIVVALIDSITQNLETYKNLKAEAEHRHAYTDEEQRLYVTLERHWEHYQDLSLNFLLLLLRDQMREALEVLNGEALHVFNEFSETLSALVRINQEESFHAAQRVEAAYLATRRGNTFFLAAAILGSILIAAGLTRLIVVPVRLLASAAETVARGNLSVQLGVHSRDEIGQLARSFNQMTNALREARTHMEQQAAQLQANNAALQRTMNQLQHTQTQLVHSEKMASLGQLTAGIAHEINNPVNFISSNTGPLKRDFVDLFAVLSQYDNLVREHNFQPAFAEVEALKKQLDYDVVVNEIDQLLEGIAEGARRTTEIVRGLRNFSRLDEEGQKRASINQGLEATLLMLKNQLKNRIEIIKDYQDFPDILCYPGKLNQAFLNILSNASQAIEGTGKIFIKTSYDGEIVTVSIKDTGRGMSDAVKQRIFEPFFTTKDVGEGTGLGLSITYGIIEDHDGNIEVYSAPGKGTEFVITLPARR